MLAVFEVEVAPKLGRTCCQLVLLCGPGSARPRLFVQAANDLIARIPVLRCLCMQGGHAQLPSPIAIQDVSTRPRIFRANLNVPTSMLRPVGTNLPHHFAVQAMPKFAHRMTSNPDA